MPDPLKNLSTLIAEQIETSWERCDASTKAMMVLDHLADEGRVAIARSRAQLTRVNSLLAEQQRKGLHERGPAEHGTTRRTRDPLHDEFAGDTERVARLSAECRAEPKPEFCPGTPVANLAGALI